MQRQLRKEARLQRDVANHLEQEAKKARLLARPEVEKSIRVNLSVPISKSPRTSVDPTSFREMRMTWCITQADVNGTWSWGQERQWSDEQWKSSINDTLSLLSKLTWKEIEVQRSGRTYRNHSQAIESVCSEAICRWNVLGIETDTVYRFRLSGKERAWGYRLGSHFYMIWYDAEHKVYPVELRGT